MATLTIIGGKTQQIPSGLTVNEAIRSSLENTFNASTNVALANERVVPIDYVIQPGDQISINPKIVNG
jgi:sulfur carrier protein ThiS